MAVQLTIDALRRLERKKFIAYADLTLPPGLRLLGCRILQGNLNEIIVPERWVAIVEIPLPVQAVLARAIAETLRQQKGERIRVSI